MTSQGSPYARFRRALAGGHLLKALDAASDLRVVPLEDALTLCLLMARARDGRFDAAARRWLQRFATERRAPLQQVVMAGAALAELGARPASEVARDTLEQLLEGPS